MTSATSSMPIAESRRARVLPYLITGTFYLGSSLPGLSSLYFVFSLVGIMYWTVKRKDELTLLLLLLGSSFSHTSLNLWNSGVVPGLPFLLLALTLMVAGVRISYAGAFITALCIVGLFVLSVGNVLVVGISPIIVDLLVVASVPLAALRFRKLSEHKFFLVLSACALITLAKMVVYAFAGVENPVLSTYTEARFLDSHDELIGLYLLFALVLILERNRLRWVTIGLFGALVFHYAASDNWLGYYGIGSQVLLTLIIFVVCILVRLPVGLIFIAGVIFILAPTLVSSLGDTEDLKLQQLISVFDILAWSDIALLPHSVHVRLAEITTFSDGTWWRQLFGGGLGGYINLSDSFPYYLGPDDYSEQQLASGKITAPHNLGYLMIKFGYVGLVLALWFLIRVYRAARLMTDLKFAMYMTLSVFLILNTGYTLKISFLLGVLWVVIRNHYRIEGLRSPQWRVNENVGGRMN